ncbi:unnamed protein product [Protopolystoma xenopodis]|uniref:Uncharacterized protein n=1 Tax=Protopolystoma xenopodis TaxID=117903 RepID=A0A3S5CNK6_9PLAT|nr:unnamed protein product [Protopolystoma xenopodis]
MAPDCWKMGRECGKASEPLAKTLGRPKINWSAERMIRQSHQMSSRDGKIEQVCCSSGATCKREGIAFNLFGISELGEFQCQFHLRPSFPHLVVGIPTDSCGPIKEGCLFPTILLRATFDSDPKAI